MCGIAGIIAWNKSVNIRQWLESTSHILQHRGPDDDGLVLLKGNQYFCSKIHHPIFTHSSLPYLRHITFEQIPQQSYNIGLLHRRLSIIDLSELAHQPMCEEKSRVWITYNGEVYNYPELREYLKTKGYSFVSNSDTEVVLKSYLYWGRNFFNHLDGMWALAIYDTRNQQLILSRDRIGVKPLYYYHHADIFAFSSEQKVFIKSKLVPFTVNQKALAKYLIDNVLEDEEEGLFKEIKEVCPGEIVIINSKDVSIQKHKYFHVAELSSLPILEEEEDKIVQTTREHVNTSIHQHLRSDVKIATSLSGGIDSSIITVSSANQLQYPIHTFSIVFPENKNIDESAYSRKVASSINSIAHFITPFADDFFKDLDELLYSQDIPIWSTSTYNQFLLMKNVKQQNIKVILSGQGSDELFAGYQHHYIAAWFSFLRKLQIFKFFQHAQKSKIFIPHPYTTLFKAWIKNHYQYRKKIISRFLSKDIVENHLNGSVHYISSSLNNELINDLSFRRLKAFLKCEDRCSMWHSVESRLPFVDNLSLTRWAFQIPEQLKLKNGISKYVLRQAFREYLPKEIYNRTDKKAFDAPLKEWLYPKFEEIKDEILHEYKELVNIKQIAKIYSIDHVTNVEVELIFKLFILSRWKKLWK